MAKRNVLHKSKLEDLKKWLIQDGWNLLHLSNNPYEILRASKAGKKDPLIIYSGKSSEHLSFADRDMSVIGAFLRDKKESNCKDMEKDTISVLKKIEDYFTYAHTDNDNTAPTLELNVTDLREILNLYNTSGAVEKELLQYKSIGTIDECRAAVERTKLEDIDARR